MKFLLEFDRKSIRTGSLIILHCIFAKVISRKVSREKCFGVFLQPWCKWLETQACPKTDHF